MASDIKNEYRNARRTLWDFVACKRDHWKGLGRYYHQRLQEMYRFVIPEGMRVLEIGCAEGNLLAALKPSRGVGIDFSPEMIRRAKQMHPDLEFALADAHDLNYQEDFDFIILSDLVNDLWDIQTVFDRIKRMTTPQTRIVINTYSRLWELPMGIAKRLNLATPTLYQNWLTVEDITNLLNLSHYEVVRHWEEILWPQRTPFLSPLCNHYLARLWPFHILTLCHVMVARSLAPLQDRATKPRVSVIVPARNEAGNIPEIMARVPEMGAGTEIIFVEGHSTDDTYGAMQKAVGQFPDRTCMILQQKGSGKDDAVRLGFSRARGDILMILDADLTVPPEDLPRFYTVLVSGIGEFANGVRLVYPMEKEAMRFINLIGNKFFSLAFSWLLGQPVKDTLCGTKVLWRRDYERIAANRSYFGDFDPFGDFDLLFGAAKLNLKIRDVPIRYRERTYGSTNIRRWRHGWLLIRMVLFALRRIKFV
jgi:ubiquinone/menaquinone biosynthesis C-methylase UbiE